MEKAKQASDEDDRSVNGMLAHALAAYLEQRELSRARLDSPNAPSVVEVTGPWGGDGNYRLVVDGVEVPHITVHKTGEVSSTINGLAATSEPLYTLTLDDRFGTGMMNWGELWTQAWFWAQAMAIAAGWTCHGPNARRIAPHGGAWPEDMDGNIRTPGVPVEVASDPIYDVTGVRIDSSARPRPTGETIS